MNDRSTSRRIGLIVKERDRVKLREASELILG